MWSSFEAMWPTSEIKHCWNPWIFCEAVARRRYHTAYIVLFQLLPLFTVVGVSELLLHHTRCFPVGRPQWTASVMFLTWVNFRRSPLPGVRLGPILVCSDLTELDTKRDLAVAAQTVYLPC